MPDALVRAGLLIGCDFFDESPAATRGFLFCHGRAGAGHPVT
jgi:hypothetical protein